MTVWGVCLFHTILFDITLSGGLKTKKDFDQQFLTPTSQYSEEIFHLQRVMKKRFSFTKFKIPFCDVNTFARNESQNIFKNKSLRYQPPTFRPPVSLYSELHSVPYQNRTWHEEYWVANVDKSPARHNIQIVKTFTQA